jgi:3-dehydroquinate synthase
MGVNPPEETPAVTSATPPGDCETVAVALGDRGYEIVIGSSVLGELPTTLAGWLARRGKKHASPGLAVIITDENLRTTHARTVCAALEAGGWNCQTVVLPSGEATKSQGHVSDVYDRLVEWNADRQTPIIAVGGGVIGDLAGFVAATYSRGLFFVQIPTTLLAQVDSSVGGKVGINHPRGKNLIGAFHQPLGVVIDTTVLTTLPERDYRSGLAEVVKYGVILDATFFEFLEQNVAGLAARSPDVLRRVVARCCRLKADVVERDEFETTGLRAVLNYGHTFAHAFETLLGYGTLLHGEAVAVGMLYASRLAERLGRIDASVTARQKALLERLGLPIRLPEQGRPAPAVILDSMRLDKKTLQGQLRFVLPTRLGHVELLPVDETAVVDVLSAAD